MTNNTETRGILRPLLWVVLAVSLAGNMALSSSDSTIPISIGLGVVALASGVALAVHHYRNR